MLRYWRAAGLSHLELPEPEPEIIDPAQVQQGKMATLGRLEMECAQCTACELHQNRTQSIFGQGPLQADIMFIGSSPSHHEETALLPFQGPEGQLLDRMFEKMGYTREQLYLCYATTCRPPNDRAPNENELKSCRNWLTQQVQLVNPKTIVTLGTVATQSLLTLQSSISQLRGQWQQTSGPQSQIPVMPTFHPGYLLKKPTARKDVWSDMIGVLDVLKARK
jgi:uracil-DNA glycosylase family 4